VANDLDQVHLPDPIRLDIDNIISENARLKIRIEKLERELEKIK
jgi:hypothetical protein